MLTQCRWTRGMGLLFAVAVAAGAAGEETIQVKVDVSIPAGKIRRLHGTNLAARWT